MLRRRQVPWVTGPDDFIKPLPVPWLGLEGDGFLGCFSPRVTDGFLGGRSSFLSVFLLGAPFLMTLGADEDALSPSFPPPSYAPELTLLPTLSAWLHPFLLRTKDGKLNTRMTKRKHKEIRKGKLTTMGVFVQPTCYRRRFWTPTVCV